MALTRRFRIAPCWWHKEEKSLAKAGKFWRSVAQCLNEKRLSVTRLFSATLREWYFFNFFLLIFFFLQSMSWCFFTGNKFSSFLDEVPFFGTWKRALLVKVPIFKCQKMALRLPKQKNRDHFLMPTSPQNGRFHVCFMRLSLLGGFWANFWKFHFLGSFGLIFISCFCIFIESKVANRAVFVRGGGDWAREGWTAAALVLEKTGASSVWWNLRPGTTQLLLAPNCFLLIL